MTITTGGDDMYAVDASDDLELENFKALLEFESGVPATDMTIYRDGKLLDGETQSIGSLGVKDGDVLLLVRNTPQQLQPNRPQHPLPSGGTVTPSITPNATRGIYLYYCSFRNLGMNQILESI